MTDMPNLVIRAGRIMDGTGRPPLDGASVLIEGSRIAGILEAGAPLPPSARVIDVPGGTILPGLVDGHVHAAGLLARAKAGPDDEEPLTDAFMRAFVAAGITTVRDTGGPDLDRTFRLFKSARAGWPRFVGSGPNLDGIPGGPWPGLVALDDPDAARRAVRELAAGGADFLKLYAWMDLDVVRAVTEEARRERLKVAGHVGYRVTVLEAAEAGVAAFEHVRLGRELVAPESLPALAAIRPRRHDALASFAAWRFIEPDSPLADEVIRRLVELDVTLVPTLCISDVVLRHVAEEEALAGSGWQAPEAVLEAWRASRYDADYDAEDRRWARVELERQMAFIGRAHAAGLRVVAGTDTPNPFIPPGRSLHRELELLVACGLTPVEAIRAGTLAAAEVLDLAHEQGSLEVGKRADLIVVQGDASTDIGRTTALRLVVQEGRIVSGAEAQ
jgi:imidazolonepropionase-like amidohydrolase